MLALPATALAQDGPTLEDTVSSLNTTWVIVAAVLVMFMQAGFAFLEIGFSRAKNAGTVKFQNVSTVKTKKGEDAPLLDVAHFGAAVPLFALVTGVAYAAAGVLEVWRGWARAKAASARALERRLRELPLDAISRDSPWSQRAWSQALGVAVPLLSDFNGEAIRAFDVAFEPLGMSDVAIRSAFLIRDGETIEEAWLLGRELPDVDAVIDAALAA